MGEEIRKAASVIAARDGERGLEVLVLERSAGSRFLPGYVAFPGGAADREDALLAKRLFGSAGEAARACAVRELLEEVGLALTADGLSTADRHSLDVVEAAPPRADQLRRIAHWIAPSSVPVRFDAEYFAVAAPAGVEPHPDGSEIAHAWWAWPSELLSEWEDGRRKLYWPTLFTMLSIGDCRTVGDLLDRRIATREPEDDEVKRYPRSTFWQD